MKAEEVFGNAYKVCRLVGFNCEIGRNADGDIVARKDLAAEAMNRVNRGFIEREGSATNSVEIKTQIGRGVDTRLDHWITGFRLLEGKRRVTQEFAQAMIQFLSCGLGKSNNQYFSNVVGAPIARSLPDKQPEYDLHQRVGFAGACAGFDQMLASFEREIDHLASHRSRSGLKKGSSCSAI